MMCTVSTTAPDVRDRDWVAARLDAGDTVTSIAAQAGVSRQTASTWLGRHGLSMTTRHDNRPSPEQLAADYERVGSIRPLATEYEISPAVMRTWLFQAGVEMAEPSVSGGRHRADVDVEQVHKFRQDGWTWQKIADHFGVAYETVRRAASR